MLRIWSYVMVCITQRLSCLQTEDAPFTQPPSQLMQHTCDTSGVAKTDTGQPLDTPHSSPTDSTACLTTPVPQVHSAAAPCGSDQGTASAAKVAAQRVDNHNSLKYGSCHALSSKGVMVKPVRHFLEGNSHMLSADSKSEVTQQSVSGQTLPQPPDSVLPEDHKVALQTCQHAEEYCVPSCVLHKWGNVLDIVTPESLATNCFTKTYTQYAKVRDICMCHTFLCHCCET